MYCEKSIFGRTDDGKNVELITLNNDNNISVSIISYGATLVSVKTPDKNGDKNDILLGHNKLADYENEDSYLGATVGRFANRIAGGKFSLNGNDYKLALNDKPNHLHGGELGFSRKIWDFQISNDENSCTVKFSIDSPDMEDGYPGNLKVVSEYILNNDNELIMNYYAESDADTIINMTNHGYWNLNGAGKNDILNHKLTLHADHYLPVDETLIPTGEIKPVEKTFFDFTTEKTVGDQIKQAAGYDHCFVVRDSGLRPAASIISPETGRKMEVLTTQPGMQFYTANHFEAKETVHGKVEAYGAFCMETENYPDSPNKDNFPSPVLKKGDKYNHSTIYKFSVID